MRQRSSPRFVPRSPAHDCSVAQLVALLDCVEQPVQGHELRVGVALARGALERDADADAIGVAAALVPGGGAAVPRRARLADELGDRARRSHVVVRRRFRAPGGEVGSGRVGGARIFMQDDQLRAIRAIRCKQSSWISDVDMTLPNPLPAALYGAMVYNTSR